MRIEHSTSLTSWINWQCSYWDETADAGLSTLSVSPVFQADAFGGNGAGSASYITDGPFVNTTLHLQRLNVAPTDYHIYRNFNISFLSGATQAGLDACFQISSYTAAWECWHGSPHAAGHGGVGGLMVDVVLSPGDPLFYLHVRPPLPRAVVMQGPRGSKLT